MNISKINYIKSSGCSTHYASTCEIEGVLCLASLNVRKRNILCQDAFVRFVVVLQNLCTCKFFFTYLFIVLNRVQRDVSVML